MKSKQEHSKTLNTRKGISPYGLDAPFERAHTLGVETVEILSHRFIFRLNYML